MTHDTMALIVATIIGILTTYLVFSLEDILAGGMLSDTVNISLALFIGGTTHLLARHFLLKKARPRKVSTLDRKPPHRR
ncbi:hypothetical protein [Sodalis sp. dw_96]|uniref:hypothetical protein n=1 Tax=Sodalis sp. dw_96 TaxID=2719794 RepID=UPI001BD5EDE0|nr:hypothetical protein [Sodalis sp. dw_96]